MHQFRYHPLILTCWFLWVYLFPAWCQQAQVTPRVPEGIELLSGLIYGRADGEELKLDLSHPKKGNGNPDKVLAAIVTFTRKHLKLR